MTGQKVFGGGGGPEQRKGGLSVFEFLVRSGSFNFQLPIGVGYPTFYFTRMWHTFDRIDTCSVNEPVFRASKKFRGGAQ